MILLKKQHTNNVLSDKIVSRQKLLYIVPSGNHGINQPSYIPSISENDFEFTIFIKLTDLMNIFGYYLKTVD